MKLRLSQIIDSKDALQRLAGERFPANIAYRIQRNIQALSPDGEAYEKARADLIRNKYGDPIEGTSDQFVVKDPEKIKLFTEEIKKLLEEETEVTIMTLKLEVLHDITPIDLMVLEYMIEKPAEEPAAQQKPARKRSGK